MNGFNLSEASDIKLGSSTITALYLGSTKLWPTIDYSKQYLTVECTSGTTNVYGYAYCSYNSTYTIGFTIYYSLDGGSTWTSKTISSRNVLIASITQGQKILLKATIDAFEVTGYASSTTERKIYFTGGTCIMYGNIMSLTDSDNFVSSTTITQDKKFYNAFNSSTALTDTSNLILPATTLKYNCYMYMFRGCKSLTTAPQLPATTLADSCYRGMFNSCTSLTTAPELPAITLANSCYREMFDGCTSLSYIKCLATDISASSSHDNWVSNVAATGTFVKPSSMTSWTSGASGIPSGWTIVNI